MKGENAMETREEILKGLPAICKLDTLIREGRGLVDIEPATARNWCLSGEYPYAWKRGRYWYVRPAEFLDWMEGKPGKASAG